MDPRHLIDQHRSRAGQQPAMWYIEAEIHLRVAARLLEVIGVDDEDSARLARVCFRLGQRIAIDSGRLAT